MKKVSHLLDIVLKLTLLDVQYFVPNTTENTEDIHDDYFQGGECLFLVHWLSHWTVIDLER